MRYLNYWLLFVLLAPVAGCHLLQLRAHTDPFYDAVLQQSPDNQAALFAQGQYLIHQGRYKEALRYYERLKKVAPNQPDTWLGLGRCYFETHDFNKARQAFDRAEQLRPSQEALLGLGATAMMRGKLDEARRLSQQIVTQYGSSPALLNLEGDIAFISGDSAKALEYYRQSAAQSPGQADIEGRIRDLEAFLHAGH